MTPPKGKKRRYKALDVNRVDLVDRGANFDRATNDGSHILLVKRAPQTEQLHQEPDMPAATETNTDAVTKRIADLEALVAKQASDSAAAIEKARADAEAKAETEKAAIQKRLDDAEEVIKAERETREVSEATSVVKSAYDLVLKAEDGGLLYRIRKALPKEDVTRIEEVLASAQEVARTSKVFSEVGRSGEPKTETGDAEAAFMAKVATLREADTKLSEPDAIVRARELFPAERVAYDRYKRDQVNPTARR
jgi:hypothetical protein